MSEFNNGVVDTLYGITCIYTPFGDHDDSKVSVDRVELKSMISEYKKLKYKLENLPVCPCTIPF